ncbi:thioesterase family protein [Saccharopolyspora taberi]|uniref:Thioesterase family protein n=1 Tax=Saccharopolyspora taberi TaxID=60895 RepID=A0ABN3VDT0_9PSEU
MSSPFTHRLRVRYSECDQQGVVFNGHYLFYYDVAVVELFRERVGTWDRMSELNLDIVVAETRLRFREGARFDDLLDISMPVTHLGNTSMIVTPEFRSGDRLIADGEVRHVFIDPRTGGKTPMPDEVRAALAA